MNSWTVSDASLTSCVHCATQLQDGARQCPRCGGSSSVDNRFDDGAWFGAGKPSEDATNDPVLEAMMAVASAGPKAMHGTAPATLPLGPSVRVRLPTLVERSEPMPALERAGPLIVVPAAHRRLLIGVATASALAALMAVLLHADGVSLAPRTATAVTSALAWTALSPARAAVPPYREGALEAVSGPSPALLSQIPAQLAVPDPPEADARTIATALGLGERAEGPAVAPLAASATPDPGVRDAPERCSEALAALALCRTP